MFPNIPEDRSTLTSAELRTLARELRAYARQIRADKPEGYKADSKRAADLANTLMAEAAEQDDEAALDADLSETNDPVDPPVDPVDDPVDPPVEPNPDDEAAAPVAELVTVGTSGTNTTTSTPVVYTTTSTGAQAAEPQRLQPDILIARDGVNGLSAGDHFSDWEQLAHALFERAGVINPVTDVRHEVAMIPGRYTAERQLHETDVMHNMRLLQNIGWDRLPARSDELTAALCAPLTPYYGLACENTLRRPVAASLPGFQAPRGGVTIMSSPSLSDVSNAGIWTHEDDDADLDQVENQKPCDEITCGTPEDFIMYAVFWCLRIKNWTALTYPELVAAFLNRGLASRARLAERQLLEGMAAGVPTITARELGYGSTVSILTQMLEYLAHRRELERWDTEEMNGWAHRWVLTALRIDQARRRRDGAWTLASEAEINSKFMDAGFNMTWFIDNPSWSTGPGAMTSGADFSAGILGTLNALPNEADILVAPVGKYAMIDRAQIQVGITGNSLYRDNTSLARNEFTFFVENYEGIVDTNSCPAHIINFPGLCHNGQQIDEVALDCAGELAA
jgi:hypothetical protein